MSHKKSDQPANSRASGDSHTHTNDYEFIQCVHSDDLSSPSTCTCSNADKHHAQQRTEQAADAHASQQAATAVEPLPTRSRYASHRIKSVAEVRHCEPDDLFSLRRFPEEPKRALLGFLSRYANSAWMRRQRLYVPMAAIAAAHDAMQPVLSNDRESFRVLSTEFDALGYLNCGMHIRSQPGQPPFWICNQPDTASAATFGSA